MYISMVQKGAVLLEEAWLRTSRSLMVSVGVTGCSMRDVGG